MYTFKKKKPVVPCIYYFYFHTVLIVQYSILVFLFIYFLTSMKRSRESTVLLGIAVLLLITIVQIKGTLLVALQIQIAKKINVN